MYKRSRGGEECSYFVKSFKEKNITFNYTWWGLNYTITHEGSEANLTLVANSSTLPIYVTISVNPTRTFATTWDGLVNRSIQLSFDATEIKDESKGVLVLFYAIIFILGIMIMIVTNRIPKMGGKGYIAMEVWFGIMAVKFPLLWFIVVPIAIYVIFDVFWGGGLMEKQDIYKIAVSVVMIHLVLIFIFEAFTFTSNNPSDSIVIEKFNNMVTESGSVNNQIASAGLCLSETATQGECEAKGCVWIVVNALMRWKIGSVLIITFYVLLSIVKIPLYLGKFLLFLGSIVFFEILISFKLLPLITNFAIRFLVGVILWVYNIVLIYYLWAFISNWRGQR